MDKRGDIHPDHTPCDKEEIGKSAAAVEDDELEDHLLKRASNVVLAKMLERNRRCHSHTGS